MPNTTLWNATMADIADINNLYIAFTQIAATSQWKEETQKYRMYLLPNLSTLSDKLATGKYMPTPARGFMTSERGKPRWIESRTVDDRIVQRVVHDQVILPAIYPKLIYDNSASLENRGTDHFRNRLLLHLSQFAQLHGNDGYILLMDFKKFFDNIRHAELYDMLSALLADDAVKAFLKMLIYENAVDVSYMTDEEYANCMNVPFNSIEYHQAVESGAIKQTGEKFMYKSMGIGSQLSQDAGLYYPHEIDNFCKIVKSIKGYGRYMDDTYIIHESKEFLWNLLHEISMICARLGIFINEKKTQIVSLHHEFSILQTRYLLHPDGNVTIMPNNDTFKRERAKLKAQAELLESSLNHKKITYDDVVNGYQSWKGNVLRNAGHMIPSVESMNNYYDKLFIEPFIHGPIPEYYKTH